MIHPESRLGKKLASGGIAKGIEIFAGSIPMVEVAAKVGFDFCKIDQHMTPFSLETIERLVEAAKSNGMTPIVRVHHFEPYNIQRILNMGAQGIIVPDVETPEMAREVVASVTFQPAGNRMACPMIRALDYGLKPWKEYAETEAKYVASCVLLESEKAVSHLEEIAAMPGLDILGIGATDLALALGIPGSNYTHPVMEKWFRKAGELCRKNNKILLTTSSASADPDYINLMASESKMIQLSSDITLFGKACKRVLAGKEL